MDTLKRLVILVSNTILLNKPNPEKKHGSQLHRTVTYRDVWGVSRFGNPSTHCRLAVYPIETLNDFYFISFLKGFWIDVLTYNRDFRSWVNQRGPTSYYQITCVSFALQVAEKAQISRYGQIIEPLEMVATMDGAYIIKESSSSAFVVVDSSMRKVFRTEGGGTHLVRNGNKGNEWSPIQLDHYQLS